MLPVVWLRGTSGVGKSTTGYRMLSTLGAAGVTAGFVDADQLRLADGLSASETALIASALPAVADRYRRSGARVLIVAGLADDREHLAALLPGVDRDRILVVHLGAEEESIRERVHSRGWHVELADASVEYAARTGHEFADLHIDTTDVSPAEVAARATEAVLTFLERTPDGADHSTGDDASGRLPQVIVVTGPGGVGTSTVGYQVFMRVARTGVSVGYLDTKQLGFLGPDLWRLHPAALRVENARDVAGNFARAGAQAVVIGCDPHAAGPLIAEIGSESVSAFWLDASVAAVTERVRLRAQGLGPSLAGDDRGGLTGRQLDDAVRQAVDERSLRSLLSAETEVIDTTHLDASQVADIVVAKRGNP